MCIAMECDLLIHIYGLLSAGGIPQKVQQARCCAAPACCAVLQPAQLPGAPGAAPWPGIPARYFYSSVFQSILIASPEALCLPSHAQAASLSTQRGSACFYRLALELLPTFAAGEMDKVGPASIIREVGTSATHLSERALQAHGRRVVLCCICGQCDDHVFLHVA